MHAYNVDKGACAWGVRLICMKAPWAVHGRRQLCVHMSHLCCAHCPHAHRREAALGLRMVFTAGVYGGGAWSGSTDHHGTMVRAGRAALSAFRPAWVVRQPYW